MKLHKVVNINGQAVDLVQDDVRLELFSPGRAVLTVRSEQPLRGLVSLDMGYNDKPLQRHFLGYVERSTQAGAQEQLLYCRELTAILQQPLPMTLRHVDLATVLLQVSQQTGLRFRVPARDYAKTRAPFFYSLGNGLQALDSLAQVFTIPDFVWHQQGDGEVYVGSWADSYWGNRPALQLPVQLFDHYQGNRSASVAALPGLRPGATINQGLRITSVTLAETQMVLQWKKS